MLLVYLDLRLVIIVILGSNNSRFSSVIGCLCTFKCRIVESPFPKEKLLHMICIFANVYFTKTFAKLLQNIPA